MVMTTCNALSNMRFSTVDAMLGVGAPKVGGISPIMLAKNSGGLGRSPCIPAEPQRLTDKVRTNRGPELQWKFPELSHFGGDVVPA